MRGRFAALAAGFMFAVIAGAAFSDELKPEEAKRFVANKLFSYTCFDGTNGAGWIHSDGSVVGTIQEGSAPVRHVSLPSGTIRLTSNSICVWLRGALLQPCFNVVQTSPLSFRGSIRGLDFAYCDFVRRNPRLGITAGEESRPHVDEIHAPLSLQPPHG
jgi:hypothetical protein